MASARDRSIDADADPYRFGGTSRVVRMKIGQELKVLYEPPWNLPKRLRELLTKLDEKRLQGS